jgi:hypothetical protein
MRKVIPLLFALMPAFSQICTAREFDASTIRRGEHLLKIYPEILFTSAGFDSEGRSIIFPETSGLTRVELRFGMYRGITDNLMAGIILPLGYTRKTYSPHLHRGRDTCIGWREIWLLIQHQWIRLPVISSSSLRVKIPITDEKPFEKGLSIGGGQIDLYPVYYFDMPPRHGRSIYFKSQIGYKYRIKKGDTKPSDEFKAILESGYELIPEVRLRLFTFSDYTRFFGGKVKGERTLGTSGYVYTIGYGVEIWPRPGWSMEMSTGGDLMGKNQFRGMTWVIGMGYLFR